MTPGELVAIITDADAAEPRGRRRRILEFRTPTLMGFTGKYLGNDENGPIYGYTRRDLLKMRATIYAAARADAAIVPGDLDDGFGDGA